MADTGDLAAGRPAVISESLIAERRERKEKKEKKIGLDWALQN
jgi:hypothetical protein